MPPRRGAADLFRIVQEWAVVESCCRRRRAFGWGVFRPPPPQVLHRGAQLSGDMVEHLPQERLKLRLAQPDEEPADVLRAGYVNGTVHAAELAQVRIVAKLVEGEVPGGVSQEELEDDTGPEHMDGVLVAALAAVGG